MEFKVGHPCEFSPEDHRKIVEAYSQTTVLATIAGSVRRAPNTIKSWLQRGKKDLEEGKDTEFSQFLIDVKEARAKTILRREALIESGIKNWQASAWLLERTAREDYGADAGIIEDILEEFKQIKALHGVKDAG